LTNKRKIYLELFNLNESSSLDDVKKRFRELAKEFHPDRNKDSNAHERFLLIKEAYEYLITNQDQNYKSVYFDNINLEKERIEKIRVAKERLKEYYKRKELKKSKEIDDFFKSNLWRFYSFFSYVYLLFSIVNMTDFFLPRTETKTYISEISSDYKGNLNDKIILVKPNYGKVFFVSNKIKEYIYNNDSITVIKTSLLNKYDLIILNSKFDKSIFKTIHNSIYIMLFVSLLMLIPFLIYLKQKKDLGYIFFVKLIFSIIIPVNFFIIINILI
jgi:curved DNA-binding protein CbpA